MGTAFTDISSALDSQLLSLEGTTPVAWQNVSFVPTKSEVYLRPTNLAGATVQAGLGSAGLDQYLGVYQVDVFATAGKGRNAAEAKADSLANHFKRGTDLLYNGVKVRLGDVSRSSGAVDQDRFVISVSINYMAHVAPR